MKSSHQNLVNALSELDEAVVPSTTGDRVVPGVIAGLIIMAFL